MKMKNFSKKHHLSFLALLLFTVCNISLTAQPVSAADARLFNPEKIIDDAIFTNSGSMSANQIQDFLNTKNSTCLKNFTTLSLTDDNGDGQVQDTTTEPYGKHGNMSAAQVIKAAADIYKINPQVILATLEKEQGLVTRSDCPAWRYNTALGYGCPDSAPCNVAAYGFTRQIDYGAYHFRGFYDDSLPTVPYGVGSYRVAYNPEQSCGSSILNIQNRATAALYSYTPYQPNAAAISAGYGSAPPCGSYGNRNFFLFFTDWFGPPTGTVLLQSPSSPAVYLVSGTTKYGIPSYDVLRAYGLAHVKVTPVSDQFMNSLADGGVLGTLFKKEGEGAVYLADNGYRFGIASYDQCVAWGYTSCLSSSTKTLDPSIFNMILNGGDLKSLMLNGNSIYVMINGQRWPFMTYKALTEKGYSSANISPITNPINSSQPIGYSIPEANSFVKFGNNPIIYAYTNNTFYAINSYDVFRSMLPPNTPVFHDTGSLYVTNPPQPPRTVPNFLSTENGAKTYMLGGGGKFNISAVTSDWPVASIFNEIAPILNKKQTDADITTNTTFQLPGGLLFQVKNGSIRPFYSIYDFFASPYNKLPAVVSNDLVAGLPQGSPLIAEGSGSLYKVADQESYDMIFTLTSEGTACSLSSIDQLGGLKLESNNVQRLSVNPSYQGVLRSLIKSANGQFYIAHNQAKTPLPSNLVANWGVDTLKACGFTEQYLSRFATRNNNVAFVRLPNGTIFYGKEGAYHQILTYSTFLNLGGNANNTLDVPYDFLEYSTPGNTIQ
jgi:hypothetical protein